MQSCLMSLRSISVYMIPIWLVHMNLCFMMHWIMSHLMILNQSLIDAVIKSHSVLTCPMSRHAHLKSYLMRLITRSSVNSLVFSR